MLWRRKRVGVPAYLWRTLLGGGKGVPNASRIPSPMNQPCSTSASIWRSKRAEILASTVFTAVAPGVYTLEHGDDSASITVPTDDSVLFEHGRGAFCATHLVATN
jgi:hypothetical protein